MANQMTKEVFTKVLVTLLQNDENIAVDVMDVKKSNLSYIGLIVHNDQNRDEATWKVSAIANVDELYKQYLNDTSILEIVKITKEILNDRDCFDNESEYQCEQFFDWEFVKNKLFLRVCNVANNVEYLQNKIYETIEDLAIVPYILVSMNEDGVRSVAVTQEMLSSYNISKDVFMMVAKASSAILFPSVIYVFSDVLKAYGVPEFMALQMIDDSPIKMIVTNKAGMDGAAALFYHGVMEQISAKMGGDYYIIPSSIHEVFILSTTHCDGTPISIEDVNSIINDVNKNEECLTSADILSYSLYMYHDGHFVKA